MFPYVFILGNLRADFGLLAVTLVVLWVLGPRLSACECFRETRLYTFKLTEVQRRCLGRFRKVKDGVVWDLACLSAKVLLCS